MDSEQAIGAAISLTGSCLSVTGLNTQKWAIGREGGSGGFRWWCAFAVFMLGEVVQASASAYATQEMLCAVSNLSVVINAIVAALIFGEPFTMLPPNRSCKSCMEGWDLGAVVILVLGTIVIALNAPSQPQSTYTANEMKDMLTRTPFLVFLGFCFCNIVATMLYLFVFMKRPNDDDGVMELKKTSREHQKSDLNDRRSEGRAAVVNAVAAASFGCLSVSLSKIVVLLIKTTVKASLVHGHNSTSTNTSVLFNATLPDNNHDTNQFLPFADHYVTYIFVVTFVTMALSNLTMLNRGLGLYDALLIIPVYYVTSSILVMIAGMLLYETYKKFTPKSLTCFLIGLSLSLMGVLLLAGREADIGDFDEEEEEELEELEVLDEKSAAEDAYYNPAPAAGTRVSDEDMEKGLSILVDTVTGRSDAVVRTPAPSGAEGLEGDSDGPGPSLPSLVPVITPVTGGGEAGGAGGAGKGAASTPSLSTRLPGGGGGGAQRRTKASRRQSQAHRRGSLLLTQQSALAGIFYFENERVTAEANTESAGRAEAGAGSRSRQMIRMRRSASMDFNRANLGRSSPTGGGQQRAGWVAVHRSAPTSRRRAQSTAQ